MSSSPSALIAVLITGVVLLIAWHLFDHFRTPRGPRPG